MRRSRLRPISLRNSYRRRVRELEYLRWLKTQPCCARDMGDACEGIIEACHDDRQRMGAKAPDWMSLPRCVRHHRLPGLTVIPMWVAMNKGDRWLLLDHWIEEHRKRYAAQGAAA